VILDARAKLLMVLVATFVTCLIVGDLIGNKLSEFTMLGTTFTWSVGMIPFPVTFLLTDLLNEFYGKQVARTVTVVGFCMALLTIALLYVASVPDFAPFAHGATGLRGVDVILAKWDPDRFWGGMTDDGFQNVLMGSTRMLIASMSAYMVGQFIDIGIFNALKRRSRNRYLWLRATGSTLVSQLLDTCVVQTIAFAGMMPPGVIAKQAGMSYALKLVVALCLTPLIYAGHALVEKRFGIAPIMLDEEGRVIPPAQERA
jgi:uncharacterized PurR-regulated membrane protein YhhQ (DUF165 family)